QANLIRSHSAGVGTPLSVERTRMLLALRINVLAKGYSASCLSWVPEKGMVGASGDLAPLAHLTLGLMGEGRMWSPQRGWDHAKTVGLPTIKDECFIVQGIGLITGTQMMSFLAAEAVERAVGVARQADIIAALSLEALRGTTKAFHTIHAVRPHPGQTEVALRLRSLLHSDVFLSQISGKSHRTCDRVQDAYTLCCIPQVHGVANDNIAFVKSILSTELNSATDNPALDYLAIGVNELASMSERRTEADQPLPQLHDCTLHCCVGWLVAWLVGVFECACTCWAARKAPRTVQHRCFSVLAIELLAACQALEFLHPLNSTTPLEKHIRLFLFPIRPWDHDRQMSPDIEAAHMLLREEKVWEAVRPYMDQYRDRLGLKPLPLDD
uniref:Uncharacterized protein n=1 Tax=Hucho hucho TaxID=62062 RepID=A0A4W5JS47_9TELE